MAIATAGTSTLQQRVADAIEREIVDGSVAPGERLRQDDLARRFGVSHIPVREALRALEARGVVSISPRRGARAATFSPDEVRDVLDVRILLETAALKAAIPRLSNDDVNAAEAAIRRIDAEQDPARWPAANRDFHLALYRAARRPALLRLIAQLHDDPRCALVSRIITGDRRKSNLEHRRLLDAAKKGATAESVAMLREHVDISAAKLERRLRAAERERGRRK
jgi:DNA-binding GntR family transcriptional regulator